MELAGKRAVVVGMEKSGVSAAKLLLERGAKVRAVDEKPHDAVFGIAVEPQIDRSFEDAELVVISPGVPADLDLLQQARARGVPVIGELELAAPFLKGRNIGITGTNGKTTTTALTGHILRESGIASQVGGNIGTPPAAMVETSRPDQWNVLELSSFQLETIQTFRATIAVCLNVTQNHLDRHHSFENYVAAKRRLFETQQPGDFAVLNADDSICDRYAASTRAEVRWFALEHAGLQTAWLDKGTLRLDGEALLETQEVPLRGRHNLANVLAASIAAKLAGAPLAKIAAAIRTFPGVEHRLEFVRDIGGVAYYNDSKATSVDATLKAIDAFPGGLWVILGGKDKGSDYTVLREPLHHRARGALLIGAAAQKIAGHLGNDAVPLFACGTLAAALEQANRLAQPGDTILLAPACASFDQFDNFEHRGRVFKELVNALAEKNGRWPSN